MRQLRRNGPDTVVYEAIRLAQDDAPIKLDAAMRNALRLLEPSTIRHCIFLYLGCLAGSLVWLGWFQAAGRTPPISLSIGIATAGLLLGGIRSWPAVALGVFTAFLLLASGRSVTSEILATLALTAGGVTTAWIIRRTDIDRSDLLEPRAMMCALTAAGAGALVAAALGTAAASIDGIGALGHEFLVRFMRLSLGLMVAAPLVIAWAGRPERRWHPVRWLGFAGAILLTIGVAAWTFLRAETGPIAWIIYPPLMLCALGFQLRGATTGLACAAILILWGTERSFGPFAAVALEARTFFAQAFVAITSASTLLLAAFADKRGLDAKRRVAEQRYRAVFEQRGVAVALLTLEGVYIDMNDRGLEICGYAKEELIGSDYRLLEPDLDTHIRRSTASVIDGTLRAFSEDRPIRTKDGEERILNVTTNVVRTADGRPDHLITVAKDITERVRAKDALAESEARLRLAQEAAGVGVWEIALPECVVHHSPESAALFGTVWTAGPWEMSAFDALLGGEQANALRRAVDRTVAGKGILELTLRMANPDGSHRWVRLHGNYAPHNGQPRLLGLALDVTRDVDAEARLREAHERLLRVARLTTMGAMASTLAHELNQPLAAMINYVETGRFLEKRRPQPDPAAIEALDMAREQALRAGGIIRRIRAFTQTGEVELEKLDLATVIQNACASVQPLNLAQDVQITSEVDPSPAPLLGDALQIEQVLTNLVRNAAEASAGLEARCVRIATSTGPEETIVAVSDNGPGLSAAMLENLFEPFRTTKETGTGLGLPICRAIVEAHGGKLWAENRAEGGAVFRFTLPHMDDVDTETLREATR